MNKQNRTQLVLGTLLILLGIWFVAAQRVPALKAWMEIQFQWPFYVIGAGALILVIGLLTGAANMAIPACIVAGIGGILYYQNYSNDWESWSFLWTLIPGFVGVGTVLAGLLGEDTRHNLARGLNLMVLSAVLLVIFAAFFHRVNILGAYGPAAILILFGLYIIVRGLTRPHNSNGGEDASS
jgi:peptidoglycan/LPS O-acetylase OafA/YrhL